jgi:hypothetical protein
MAWHLRCYNLKPPYYHGFSSHLSMQLKHEFDQSPPFHSKVKNELHLASTLPGTFLRHQVLLLYLSER